MSPQLISRSPDLARLASDGYEVDVRAGRLVVGNVPYVNADRKVRRASLVSELTLAGDVTAKPGSHVVLFTGEQPCDSTGKPLGIESSTHETVIEPGLVAKRAFSSPTKGATATLIG